MSRRAFVSMVTAGAPGHRRRSAAPKARNVAAEAHSTSGAAIGLYLDCSVLTVPAALGDRFFLRNPGSSTHIGECQGVSALSSKLADNSQRSFQ
jgi:hypothetical protein